MKDSQKKQKHINKEKLVLFFIVCLGFFLRFLYLDHIPNGLQQDETSIGYNAYSILKTGKDEYGIPMPVFFKAFGEYKLPVLIYATIPSIAIFGLNEYGVRIPSALFGTFTIIAFYFFLRELFGDQQERTFLLVSTFLLAINPWHIFFSRGAFEVTPALFFLVVGSYLFLTGTKRHSIRTILLSILCFGLPAYTYNLCRLLAPLLLVGFYLFSRKNRIYSWKKIDYAICSIFLLALMTPYILNMASSTKGLTGTFLFTNLSNRDFLTEFRGYVWLSSPWLARIATPMPFLLVWAYVRNILSYLSGPYFFINGPTHPNHTTGTSGLFYAFELVTMIVGVIQLRKYSKTVNILLYWLIVTLLLAAATREAPYATRSFFFIVPMVTFSGYGLTYLGHWIRNQKDKRKKYVWYVVFASSFYVSVLPVWLSYLYRFPVVYAKNWRSAEKEVALYIQNNMTKYDAFILDPSSDIKYTSLLFYMKYPPEAFQKNVQRYPDTKEGFSNVKSMGKIFFRDSSVLWDTELPRIRSVILSSPAYKPLTVKPDLTWYYPQRPAVAVSDEQLLVSFITEEAFNAYISTGSATITK